MRAGLPEGGPFRCEEIDSEWARGREMGNMRIRAAVSSGTGKGNLVPDFSFPFLDDLRRFLVYKIVMVYI